MTQSAATPAPSSSDLAASLRQALASDDDVVRAHAARAIGLAGLGDRSTLDALARVALVDAESGVRAAATTALNALDAPPRDLLTVAVELLEHPDQTVRARAGWAIGKLDPDVGAAAVGPLRARLAQDPAIDGRFGAAWAFGRMRFSSEDVIDALRAALLDAEPDVRAEAARAIGRIGSPAVPALPDLIRCVDDGDPLVREQVVIAIGRLVPDAPEAPAALRRAVADRVDYVRRAAAAALASIGAPPAVDPELPGDGAELAAGPEVAMHTDRLRADDAFGRAEAAWLLAKEGGRLDDAVTLLLITQALVDRDSDARWSAARSIGRIATRSPRTTLAIVQVLRHDPDPDVRQAAAAALSTLWKEAADVAVAALADALNDPDPMVREDAAETLGLIGEAASPACTGLERALQDPHGGVRARAAASLATIAPA